MVLQVARGLLGEIKLNYNAVHFDHRLIDCKHIRVSLTSDVILYTIGHLRGFGGETRDYLESAYPYRVMRQSIQSLPINLYSPTINKLERVLRPKYRSFPSGSPRGLSQRLIGKFKYRMKNLLDRDNIRILWNHLSLEKQVDHLTGKNYHFVQQALEAWKNKKLSFEDLQFILLSKLENAVPLTFDDKVQTFLYREKVPYLETRVPCKLPTELPLLKVK